MTASSQTKPVASQHGAQQHLGTYFRPRGRGLKTFKVGVGFSGTLPIELERNLFHGNLFV